MAAIPLADGPAFTLDVDPTDRGIALVLGLPGSDGTTTVRLALDRADSRTLAQAILAAGGDGHERTFAPQKDDR